MSVRLLPVVKHDYPKNQYLQPASQFSR